MDLIKISEKLNKFKDIKYSAQLAPAAAVLLLSLFGFNHSKPVFEAIDWTKAKAVENENAPSAADTSNNADAEQAVGNYTDGTYTGVGVGFRGNVTMQVIVSNKQITYIKPISYEDDEAYFKRALTLTDSILKNQTWEVDTVSGATYSSRGIKEAVKNALTGEKSTSSVGDSSSGSAPSSAPAAAKEVSFTKPDSYKDGTYTGTSSGYGGTVTVNIKISGGKIISVEASGPNETPSYWSKAKTLTNAIIEKQTPNVDAVSGATYSSNGIINAAKNALNKASGGSSAKSQNKHTRKQKTKTKKILNKWISAFSANVLDGEYKDGKYIGIGDGYGGKIKIQLIIKNNKITKIKVTEASGETGALNSSVSYKNKEGKTCTFGTTYKEIFTRVLKFQTSDVDAVTGATFSSDGLIDAVENALEKAKKVSSGGEDNFPDTPTDNTNDKNEKKYTASADVTPDSDNEFEPYTMTVEAIFNNGNLVSITNPPVISDSSNSPYNKRASKMIPDIIQKQSGDIDSVSGATCSSNALKQAVSDIFKQAGADNSTSSDSKDICPNDKKAESDRVSSSDGIPSGSDAEKEKNSENVPAEQIKPLFSDGDYKTTVSVEPDEENDFDKYNLTLTVTISGGKIVSITNPPVISDLSNSPYNKRASKIIPDIIQSQSADVDSVSGATCSSEAIKKAINNALSQAKTGQE